VDDARGAFIICSSCCFSLFLPRGHMTTHLLHLMLSTKGLSRVCARGRNSQAVGGHQIHGCLTGHCLLLRSWCLSRLRRCPLVGLFPAVTCQGIDSNRKTLASCYRTLQESQESNPTGTLLSMNSS
jgi:hypothetical protein